MVIFGCGVNKNNVTQVVIVERTKEIKRIRIQINLKQFVNRRVQTRRSVYLYVNHHNESSNGMAELKIIQRAHHIISHSIVYFIRLGSDLRRAGHKGDNIHLLGSAWSHINSYSCYVPTSYVLLHFHLQIAHPLVLQHDNYDIVQYVHV